MTAFFTVYKKTIRSISFETIFPKGSYILKAQSINPTGLREINDSEVLFLSIFSHFNHFYSNCDDQPNSKNKSYEPGQSADCKEKHKR